MEELPNWEDLPSDLLFLIAARVASVSEFSSFRGVCRRWRLSLSVRHPVVVGETLERGGRVLSLTHHSLAPALPVSLTQFFPPSDARPMHFCCGATYQWMVMHDPQSRCLSAYSPMRMGDILLPAWFPLGELRAPVGSPVPFLVDKVVFSSSPSSNDCIAMALCCFNTRLARWDADQGWQWLPEVLERTSFADIIASRGFFYIVTMSHDLYAYPFTRPDAHLKRFQKDPNHSKLLNMDRMYLAEDEDGLMLITILDRPLRLRMYLYSMPVIQGSVRYIQQHTVGDRAVFLGRNNAFSLSADYLPGGQGDVVFLIDYFWPQHIVLWSLPQGTFSRLSPPNNSQDWRSSLWLLLPQQIFQGRQADEESAASSSGAPEDHNDHDPPAKRFKSEKHKHQHYSTSEKGAYSGVHALHCSRSLLPENQIEGPVSSGRMLRILNQVIEERTPTLVSARMEAEERATNIRLREEQVAACRAALEADQARERQRREHQERLVREAADAEMKLKEVAEDQEIAAREAAEKGAALARRQQEKAMSLGTEPEKGPDVTQVVIWRGAAAAPSTRECLLNHNSSAVVWTNVFAKLLEELAWQIRTLVHYGLVADADPLVKGEQCVSGWEWDDAQIFS